VEKIIQSVAQIFTCLIPGVEYWKPDCTGDGIGWISKKQTRADPIGGLNNKWMRLMYIFKIETIHFEKN